MTKYQGGRKDNMKQTGKKAVILMTAAAMAAASLTGCGSVSPDKVVATVDDTDIPMGVVNFYIRYQQGVYETNYAQMMGGIDTMWSTEDSDGVDYEESMKNTSLELLEQMTILEDHMEDYDVSLSDEEKANITETAKSFAEANEEEALEVVSGDQASVERLLTLMTIQKKVYDEVIATADTNVSDEEAKQGKMEYVLFSFQKTDDDGNMVTLSDEEKEELKKTAEEFAKGAKKADDFYDYAKEEELNPGEVAFDEESTAPTEDVVKALLEAGVGGTTDVIEASNGYYVARYVTDFDEEATENEKETIISQRQQDKFSEVYNEWKEEAKITENKKLLKRIDFEKQGVTVKTAEETEE